MSDNKQGAALAASRPGLWKKFMSLNGSAVFLAMIAYIILVEIIMQVTGAGSGEGLKFITASNFMAVLRSQVYVGIMACGITLVMITGNIDLSIGNMMTFLGCICAGMMMDVGSGPLAIVGTLALGALCGLFNGVLVSYVKLNSFITTLGASSIYGALALLYSKGKFLVVDEGKSAFFDAFGLTTFGPVHILIVWFAVVVAVVGFVLSRTVFGQRLYTIGANPVAARFSGIRSKRDTCLAYVITGLLVGLAAAITIANVHSINPQSTSNREMDVILAVVLGGTSVLGGKGSIWGTVIGVLFAGVLSSGFTQLNITQYAQWVIMGIIMVAALSLDVLKERGIKLWKKK